MKTYGKRHGDVILCQPYAYDRSSVIPHIRIVLNPRKYKPWQFTYAPKMHQKGMLFTYYRYWGWDGYRRSVRPSPLDFLAYGGRQDCLKGKVLFNATNRDYSKVNYLLNIRRRKRRNIFIHPNMTLTCVT